MPKHLIIITVDCSSTDTRYVSLLFRMTWLVAVLEDKTPIILDTALRNG